MVGTHTVARTCFIRSVSRNCVYTSYEETSTMRRTRVTVSVPEEVATYLRSAPNASAASPRR
jgi:hypothetical protein